MNTGNTCFVCLEKCNIKRCSQCTLYAHPKCWKQYIDSCQYYNCDSTTFTFTEQMGEIKREWGITTNIKCPQCKNLSPNPKIFTRGYTKSARTKQFQIEMNILEDYRKLNIYTPNTEKRMRFEYIKRHASLLKTLPKLSNTIQTQLRVLYHIGKWEDARWYYQQIFKTSIY